MHRFAFFIFASCLALALSSCASLSYYSQAVGGQFNLMRKARPVEDVIADTTQPEDVRRKLDTARAARRFSSRELHLPDNRSYETYVDVGGPAVVWNVVATPPLSVAPLQWCFPVAGCFDYKGYFSRPEAERFAASLKGRGLDVHVAGASAYSTLGWFDDPILSTMVRRSEEELVGTIFHELAHQKLYIPGDSAFNEAFAVTVADEGVRRWYRDQPEAYRRYQADEERFLEVNSLLLRTRERLDALFREPVADEEKQRRKSAVFEALHAEYAALKIRWGGDDRLDGWIPAQINNAHLALTATYRERVPAFKALLAQQKGDLERFYLAAQALAELTPPKRQARLDSLIYGDSLRTAAR